MGGDDDHWVTIVNTGVNGLQHKQTGQLVQCIGPTWSQVCADAGVWSTAAKHICLQQQKVLAEPSQIRSFALSWLNYTTKCLKGLNGYGPTVDVPWFLVSTH